MFFSFVKNENTKKSKSPKSKSPKLVFSFSCKISTKNRGSKSRISGN